MSELILNKNEMNMTEGNLLTKIFKFSLPFIIANILQLFYNAADLIVCGQFGSENSVGAISATGSLSNLIIQLFIGLSVGANVLMARCFGAKDKEKANNVVHTSMFISVFFGVILAIFGFCFSRYFLELMGTPDDVIDLSTDYIKIYFLGIPFSMLYNFGASLLRATGDTKRPFYYLALAGVINVILNLILVINFKLDVKGVAIATIISQFISAVLIVRCLVKNKGFLNLNLRHLKIHKKEFLEILEIGIPAGVQGAVFSLSNVLLQSSINSLGSTVVNGNGASSSLEGFVHTCMASISTASVSFVSANYGARKIDNIKKTIINTFVLVTLIGMITGGLMIIFGRDLLHIYIKDPNAIAVGRERLTLICFTYFLCGIMDVFANSLRGLGYSFVPSIITILAVCGFRIFWIYVMFPQEAFHTLKGLMYSYPLSWFLSSFFQLILLLFVFKKVKNRFHKEKLNLI